MSEDTEPHLPEAPPPEQNPGFSGDDHPFWSAVAGFFSAGGLAFVIAVMGMMMGFIAFVASGPLAGLILWGFNRNSNIYFARGAIVFGIVSFLVVGSCFMFLASAFR